MTQFVLFGGKGGVGKTTMAAAAGHNSARDGDRTLVVSTDPAHSIGDAYDCSVGEDPTAVPGFDRLHAMEIDPKARFRERYGDTFGEVIDDVQSLGIDIGSEDVQDISTRGLVPGADEVAVLDLFAEFDDHDDWDTVVFDTAPTGHTLRLLDLPDVMNATVGKFLTVKGQLDSVANTVKGFLRRDNGGSNTTYNQRLDRLEAITKQVRTRLQNGDKTAFNAVAVPERMVVEETQRLLDELDEDGVHVDRVLANKVLEDASEDCPTCWPRYQTQQDVLEQMRAQFDPPVEQVPLVADEAGRDRVRAVAEHIRTE